MKIILFATCFILFSLTQLWGQCEPHPIKPSGTKKAFALYKVRLTAKQLIKVLEKNPETRSLANKAQGQVHTGRILSAATGAFGVVAFGSLISQNEVAIIFGPAFVTSFVLNALTKKAYHRTTQEAVNIYNDSYLPKTDLGAYWEIGASENGLGLHFNF